MTPVESPLPFSCPHCGHEREKFHYICPECGRPLMRDYIDWRMYPRDHELQGTLFYNPFWARIWLGLWLALLVLGFVVNISFTITGIFR
jgi:hypothetical protein